jgi:hypothetical protein
MRGIKLTLVGNVRGHSVRLGGVTALAIAGVPGNSIQEMRGWSSDAYQQHIRRNLAPLQILISRRAIFDCPP